MVLGWARVAIRCRLAVAALIRLILPALVGLVASIWLSAPTAHAQAAGTERLNGTAAASAHRPRLRCLSITGATARPRNDLTARHARLSQRITGMVRSAPWRSRIPPITRMQSSAWGPKRPCS